MEHFLSEEDLKVKIEKIVDFIKQKRKIYKIKKPIKNEN